jgi:hypothetical protein
MDMGSPMGSMDVGDMSAGMNVGSEESKSGARLSHLVNDAKFVHSMYPQIGMASEGLADTTKPQLTTGAMHSRSATLSSCDEQACSQILFAASPPGAGPSETPCSNLVATGIGNPVDRGTGFHRIERRIPPPKNLPHDFTTILRI